MLNFITALIMILLFLINSFQILDILSKKEKKKYLHYAVLFDYSFFISDVNCFKFKKLEEKIRYMGAF